MSKKEEYENLFLHLINGIEFGLKLDLSNDEIMDEYLQHIYETRFWGYSLPLYISGTLDVHPNYAIYLAEKNTLTEKSLYEIMSNISASDKLIYKKDIAERESISS